MQIRKIISGAQAGADRAALDFAIEYDIEHGGWVPKGRRAEDGIIASKYKVWELPEAGYPERTEKNVLESDGTLIISHGDLTGGSLLTFRMAEKYVKPLLHININDLISFDAAIDIYEWINAHGILVLNVAGPRASKDAGIYQATYNILETLYHIDIIANAMPDVINRQKKGTPDTEELPATVEEAVNDLMNRLTRVEKMRIASRKRSELNDLAETWGKFIRRRFSLKIGNQKLIADCRNRSDAIDLTPESAAMMILSELWKKLRETGHLRIVK